MTAHYSRMDGPSLNHFDICIASRVFSYHDCCCYSVAKSCLDSLRPHGLQHARLPCPCLPEFAQVHVHWVGDAIHLILCHALPLQSLPASGSFPVSRLWIRWPKYWSFSFSISPSNEYPGLISFRMDWLDILAVQGTLKSLLQHHSSEASILQHSAFL